MYPRVVMDLEKLKKNTTIISKLLDDNGITSKWAVNKGVCGNLDTAKIFIENGFTAIADSRLENLEKVKELDCKKVLLRLPMQSEVDRVISIADCSLNSEIETIKLLDKEAGTQSKVHEVLLMIDLGDLREGIWFEDNIVKVVEEILKFENIDLIGVGTNLTCYGGVIPTSKTLIQLIEIANKIKSKTGVDLKVISGGNSSSLHLLNSGELPNAINNLRIGEALLLGGETSYGKMIEGCHNDAFILEAEIIELKDKRSTPIGTLGKNAFGEKPSFTDVGIHKRAILAVGREDVTADQVIFLDGNIKAIGASSDHLIVELAKDGYKVGDIIKMKLTYGGLLNVFTSEYVKKIRK